MIFYQQIEVDYKLGLYVFYLDDSFDPTGLSTKSLTKLYMSPEPGLCFSSKDLKIADIFFQERSF
jgi:hypothetical protein